jgi:hypothetical protein
LTKPLPIWFPEYSDPRTPEKQRISLRHLLTMSARLERNEYVPFSVLGAVMTEN